MLAVDLLNTDPPAADAVSFARVRVAAVGLAGAVVGILVPDAMVVLGRPVREVGAVVAEGALAVAPVGVGVAAGVVVPCDNGAVGGEGGGRGAEDGGEDEGEEGEGLHGGEW